MRAIKLTLSLAALLAASACASSGGRPPPTPTRDEVLAARLDLSSLGLQVGLSEPGHVAVFAVRPGGGTTMVYPTASRPSELREGWTTLFPHPSRRRPSAGEINNTLWYLVLVASKEPLGVDEYIQNPTRLRNDIGPQAFLANDAEATIEALESLLQGRAEDELTVQVQTTWLPPGRTPVAARIP